MTPEERARHELEKINGQGHIFDCDVAVIAAAIREAVEAEREACIHILDRHKEEGPFDKLSAFDQGAHTVAVIAARTIRARGKP